MTVRVTTLREDDPERDRLEALNGFQRDVREELEAQPRHVFKDLEVDGGDTDVDVAVPLDGSPRAAYVAYVRDADADADIASAITLHWEPREDGIRVRQFHGLTSGTRYTVRLHVIGA